DLEARRRAVDAIGGAGGTGGTTRGARRPGRGQRRRRSLGREVGRRLLAEGSLETALGLRPCRPHLADALLDHRPAAFSPTVLVVEAGGVVLGAARRVERDAHRRAVGEV